MTKLLDEAEALARAVEALRAASLHQVADGLERFPEDAFSAMRDAFDSDTGIEEWAAIRGAFGALLAVRAGYGVTPPAPAPAAPDEEPHDPPPRADTAPCVSCGGKGYVRACGVACAACRGTGLAPA